MTSSKKKNRKNEKKEALTALHLINQPTWKFLKLVPTIFYQIFIFLPNDSPSKTMKSVFYFI